MLELRGSMTPGTRQRVRRHAGRLAAVAGGRLAPRRRVPVRAPGGVSGRSPAPTPMTRQKELLARFRMASQAERRGSATCCASTWPRTSRSSSRREPRPRRVRRAAVRLLPGGRARASRCVVRSTTLAAPLLLALQRALLEREAWPLLRASLPGQDAAVLDGGARRAPRRLPAARPRGGRGDRTRCCGSTRRQNTRALAARRPGADDPRRPRPRAGARGDAGAALVRDAVADAGGRPAGGDGDRATSRRSSRGALFLDRDDPIAAWRRAERAAGDADRAAVAGARRSGSRPRAPT